MNVTKYKGQFIITLGNAVDVQLRTGETVRVHTEEAARKYIDGVVGANPQMEHPLVKENS